MIAINIPGYKNLKLDHLVLDYNGTLACDGQIISDSKTMLRALSKDINIHVLTADTFGSVKSQLSEIACNLFVLPPSKQDVGKRDYVRGLGVDATVCIGNGRNDRLMLEEAALGICVVLEEGVAAETLTSADVVCTSIVSALALLRNPLRLVATLRC